MKDRNLKALSFFNFCCMVLTLIGAGAIFVKAETIAQYLANGVYVKAGAIAPTNGAVAVADGTSFVQSTTPAFNGANVTVDGTTTIKNYIDSVAVGVESKDARLATIAVLSGTPSYVNGVAGVGATLISTAFGALSVDGTTVAVADRILVKNQDDATQNGIYTVTATGGGAAFYTLTRALDNNSGAEISSFLTSVTAGGTLNGTQWLCTAVRPVTIGSTNITFAQFTANISAGSVTGTLPVTNGGTGAVTLTGAMQGNGTGSVTAGTLPVNVGGTGIATITSGNVIVGQGTSAVISTGVFSNGAVPLPGAKYVNLTLQGTAGTGNQDLKDASTGAAYVVPANKIAIIGAARIYNGNAATSVNSLRLKVSGTYYQLSTSTSVGPSVGSALAPFATLILNAGEGLGFNSDKATQNVWATCVECSSATYVKTYRILALANGNNTLYTVPANKTAILLATGLTGGGTTVGLIALCNASGGSLNYYANIVTSGGAVATTNQTQAATALADVTGGTIQAPFSMSAGDFINVNTSGGGAGQVAWVTVIEY